MLGYVKDFIAEIGNDKDSYEAYDENHDLYAFSKTITLDYEQKRPHKGNVLKDERRMYLHLYYNPEKRLEDEKALNRKLSKLRHELESGQRKANHENEYGRYFIIKETPKRGLQITVNQEAIDKARERYGSFALVSNEVKDPLLALNIYRTRDVVEKAYFDIKDRLNMRRTLVSSESTLEGKIFVEFVELIYLSYIKQRMLQAGLFAKYTMDEVLDELDSIECFIESGKAPIQGEVLVKQEQLYRDLGVIPLLAAPENR